MRSFQDVSELVFEFDHIGETSLPLFSGQQDGNPRTVRNAVVLGNNGVGKSSIARLLSHDISKVGMKEGDQLRKLDSEKNIFVFDEDFVNTKVVSAGAQGLEPLVLIGDQADRATEIDELDERIRRGEKALRNMNDTIVNLESRVTSSRKNLEDRLKEKTGNSSWLQRSKRSNGPTKLTQQEMDKILKIEVATVDLEQAKSEFEDLSSQIQSVAGGQPVNWVPVKATPPDSLEDIRKTLKELPARALTAESELEVRIGNANLGLGEVQKRLSTLCAPETAYCPKCFQSISESYKAALKDALDTLRLSLAGDELSNRARLLKVPEMPAVEETFAFDSEEKVKKLNEAIELLNSEIQRINHLLDEKADNPNRDDLCFSDSIADLVDDVNAASTEVASMIDQFNGNLERLKKLEELARACNRKISAVEVQNLAREYRDATEKRNIKIERRIEQSKRIGDFRRQRDELQSLQNGQREAADRINQLLRLVFGSNSISLSPAIEGYAVVNRELSLSPSKLSTGERNILGLCYFLVRIAQDGKFSEAFDRDQLIVLDDPSQVLTRATNMESFLY